ncbi:MAG: recombinase family protein [Streptosporangiales bacterium]|nr:recombinase family protein [Streptosporangiales bacterium]
MDTKATRALIATRKSGKIRDGGTQRDGITHDTQDDGSHAFCDRQGWTVTGVARDTISGRTAPIDRKNLGRWLKDPGLRTRYDVIVAYKSDRYSRGEDTDWSRIETWAADHGKTLVMVDNGTGIRYPARDDSDYWQWVSAKRQAGREWNEIRERSVRTQKTLRNAGALVGRPPFGYVPDGNTYSKGLVPTEEGRRLVPQIYQRCIAGESLASIARWLDAETWPGIPFRYHRWYPAQVGRLIRKPTYIGQRCATPETNTTLVYGKTLLTCEPLVDAGTFTRAALALEERPKRGPAKAENRAMLAGVLFCPHCPNNSPMYRIPSRSHRPGVPNLLYYRCFGRGSQRKGCGNSVRLDEVDDIMNDIMHLDFNKPIKAWTIIPGNEAEIEARIEEVNFKLRQLPQLNLDFDEEDRRRALLRDQLTEARNAERHEDEVIWSETDERYSEQWDRTPVHQRAAWLADKGFTVTATKDDAGEVVVKVYLAADR